MAGVDGSGSLDGWVAGVGGAGSVVGAIARLLLFNKTRKRQQVNEPPKTTVTKTLDSISMGTML